MIEERIAGFGFFHIFSFVFSKTTWFISRKKKQQNKKSLLLVASFGRWNFILKDTLTFNRDLNHTNQYIVGLALCALGNICSAEMARDLAPEIERLLQFRDPNIRKKVSLTSLANR